MTAVLAFGDGVGLLLFVLLLIGVGVFFGTRLMKKGRTAEEKAAERQAKDEAKRAKRS